MRARALSRCFPLLLALLLAACATGESARQANFPPLDFSFLPPLPLNVASVEVQTQFVPSGQPPDVTQYDPISPVAMLRRMAEERLTAAGTSGRAVFIINDASMVRSGDTIVGVMSVTLNVYTSAGLRAGFAQATVTRQIAGAGEDLPATLYGLTRQLMQQMNVEFEFQVRRSLHDWLLTAGATPSPVQQAPLEAAPSPGAIPPSPPLPYAPPSGPLTQPMSGPPPDGSALPTPLVPAAPLAPPAAPPPATPALPAPVPRAAPLPQPGLPPPGPVLD